MVGQRLGIRERTLRERSGDAAWSDGSSAGAARQEEIGQHSRELAMRQMSDNRRLSDIAGKQLAGTRQRGGRKRSGRAVNHNFSARPYALRSWAIAILSNKAHQNRSPCTDQTRRMFVTQHPLKDPIGSTCSTRSPAQAGSQSHKHLGSKAGGFQTATGFWPITRRLRLIARKYSIPSAAIASPTIASPSASSASVSSQAA